MPSLERKDIENLIPHRTPFLLVDRVIDYEIGVSLHAEKTFKEDEAFFVGHFPGNPIVPGVLLIEAAAQASCVLTMLEPSNRDRLFFFGSVDKFRFLRPVLPGDLIRINIEILRAEASSGIVACKLFVENERVAKGRISYAAQARTSK